MTLWKRVILLGLTALSLAGCAFSPSQLNANPARFDGMTVVVQGFVSLENEAPVLFDSKARKYGKSCVRIANPEFLYRTRAAFDAKTIVFQGKFIANYRDGNALDVSGCPLSTAIVINEAALARRYRSALRQP